MQVAAGAPRGRGSWALQVCRHHAAFLNLCPPLQRDAVEMLGWVHAQPLPRASVPLQVVSRTIVLSSQGSEAGKT